MNQVKKSPSNTYAVESIYVTSKQQKAGLDSEDPILMALKLALSQRKDLAYEPSLKSLEKAEKVWAITLETKNHSALLFVHPQGQLENHKINLVLEGLRDKLFGIIRSTHEKIYFMDVLNITIEKTPLEAVLAACADYCFMSPFPGFQANVGLFKMDKLKDEDRFLPMSLELIDVETPVDNDLYLRMRRNNRYIKYVKKGGRIERRQHDRLTKKGVKDLYIPSDRPVNIQAQKVMNYFSEILKEFHRLGK
jgi:hypothetical protein